jgi:hypothetical protein
VVTRSEQDPHVRGNPSKAPGEVANEPTRAGTEQTSSGEPSAVSGRTAPRPSEIPAVERLGPGEPLEPNLRGALELEHAHDLRGIRIHRDAHADIVARSLGAVAFTAGSRIGFRSGAYDPRTTAGKSLVAHEAAHVAQQAHGRREGAIGTAGDPWEEAADAAAAGRRVTRPAGIPPGIQRQDPRHARGFAGEQQMGFTQYRWEDGWAVVRGPSGAGGHGITSSGEDGLFYNVRTGILRIADNKAFTRGGNVSSATAIDPTRNLLQNLDEMIADVEGIGSSAEVPIRQDVLRLLRQTRAALRLGQPIPGRVQLVVHNEYGSSSGITQRLQDLGVRFVDAAQPVVPAEGSARPPLGLRTPPEGAPGAVAPPEVAVPAAAAPEAAAPEVAAGEAAVAADAPAATAAAGIGAAGLVRAAALFAIEFAVMFLISLGLSYLQAREEQRMVRRRLHELEPSIQAALERRAGQVAQLQAAPGQPTVWAHVTIELVSGWTTAGAYGFMSFSTMLHEVNFAGAEVGTAYVSDRRDVHGETYHDMYSTTTIHHEFVTYSVPIAYDPYALHEAGRVNRLRQIDRDAANPSLPEAVVQRLFEERQAFIEAQEGLGEHPGPGRTPIAAGPEPRVPIAAGP